MYGCKSTLRIGLDHHIVICTWKDVLGSKVTYLGDVRSKCLLLPDSCSIFEIDIIIKG
jgi:hypothetical protein